MSQIIVTTAEPRDSEERSLIGERDEFLRLAKERFHLAAEAETETRRDSLEDLKFYAGDQWPAQIVADRSLAGRPCLTINRLLHPLHQVINDQRQSRPSIQVNPVGNGADVDTAQIFQGLVRHIEVASDAEVAYDTAFQCAVIGGLGYFRVITEYAEEELAANASAAEMNDQEIRIKPILDPFTVYFDPTCQERDYSDAKFAFVIEDLTREQYKEKYPTSEVAGLPDFRSIGDGERGWFQNSLIRTAEYWWVETTRRTKVALVDGKTAYDDEIPEDAQIAQRNGEPITREVTVRRVRSAIINAREILVGSNQPPFGKPWAGKWIGIIPVLGEELIIDGKRKLFGIVRYAKDPQRQYNYMRSALVEAVALAPKAPYIAEEGQLENHEEEWRDANVRNFAVLKYKKQSVDGKPVPPPQRNFGEPPIMAIATAISEADQDLKATTGIYDPSLGQRGPQESGRAIIALQKQGGVANFGYIDNLARSIRHLGRLLVDLGPKIYDRSGRVVRIVKPDQTNEIVTLNQPFEKQPGSGEMKLYDLNAGKYDITISVGPGYESKRQEFVQSVLQLVQTAPQIAQLIMDLVVRHMDWPGAAEIADRLKKMLPEQLQEKEPQPGQAQIPPEFQQKMEALLQQHAALTEQLNQANSVIESRRMELESRERIAAVQEQTKLLVAELKAQSQAGIEMLRQQVAAIDRRLELLHATRTLEEEVPGGGEDQQMRPAA